MPNYDIIEKIRLHKKLTHKELASEIGLNTKTIENIISGKLRPNTKQYRKIERWLDLQFLYAMQGSI